MHVSPADAPPKSLTEVGHRAMANFLYDIDKYNDDEDKENLNSGVPALQVGLSSVLYVLSVFRGLLLLVHVGDLTQRTSFIQSPGLAVSFLPFSVPFHCRNTSTNTDISIP